MKVIEVEKGLPEVEEVTEYDEEVTGGGGGVIGVELEAEARLKVIPVEWKE